MCSVRRVLCVSDVLCTRIEGNARKIFTLLYGDIGSMMRFATGDLYVRKYLFWQFKNGR